MKIKEIQVKTCMTRSKLSDYVINPYTGCSHACKYCYADFIKKFQNITDKWGEFVFAKANCPELLPKEIEKNKPGSIFISSVCDCYMPEEAKFKLTRQLLEIFAASEHKGKFELSILTKSSLVKRDFDLLKELDIELGMSINQLDERIAKVIEPGASSPKERLDTLKEAHAMGIKTFGFVSPVLPGLEDMEAVFSGLKEAGVEYVWVELFNMRGSAIDKMLPVYRTHFADKLAAFEWARENQRGWHDRMRKEAEALEHKYGLNIHSVIVHNE